MPMAAHIHAAPLSSLSLAREKLNFMQPHFIRTDIPQAPRLSGLLYVKALWAF